MGSRLRSGTRWLGDGVLATIVFLLITDQGAGGVPELGVFGGLPQPAQGLVAAAVALSVLVRRRTPYPLLVTGAAALIVTIAPWGLVISAYTLSAQTRRPGWYPVFAGALPLLVFARLLVEGASAAYALILTVLVTGTPTLLGLWVGARRALLETLRERAERVEREQRVMADQARGQERARIAREMHDVVAHRVSLMVLHASALEVTLADQKSAQQARTIRETGREALTELREVLNVLREEGQSAAVEPQPTIAALDGLVEQPSDCGFSTLSSTPLILRTRSCISSMVTGVAPEGGGPVKSRTKSRESPGAQRMMPSSPR